LLHANELRMPVLPLEPGTKKPLGKLAPHGVNDATTNEAQIRERWLAEPDANIGAATGNGIVVIDVDGVIGEETLKKLEEKYGALPAETRWVRTPHGWHIYLRVSDSSKIKNTVSKLGEGIDVRSDVGYVVGTGSVVNGILYTLATSSRDILGAPIEWENELVRVSSHQPQKHVPETTSHRGERLSTPYGETTAWGRACLDGNAADVREAPPGTRNDTLNTKTFKVGQGVESGHINEDEARRELLDAAKDAGLCEREARKTIESGLRSGKQTPRGPAQQSHHASSLPCSQPPPAEVEDESEAEGEDGGWRAELLLTIKGQIRPTIPNAAKIVRNDKRIAGRIAQNERNSRVHWIEPRPYGNKGDGAYIAQDNTHVNEWLQDTYGVAFTNKTIHDAVDAVASEVPFDQVRDYLCGLTWDEQPRLGSWLTTYACAEQSAYTSAIGQKWLISAVARTMKPACQADYMLVLEGSQGVGKSTLLRTLASPEWYAEVSISSLKDSILAVHGPWICVWEELSGMVRADLDLVKSFVTRLTDHVRFPYEPRPLDYARRCVFAGTTNHSQYLIDSTGGRRFWPIKVQSCDAPGIARDRDQLWAEAMHLYKAGVSWWLTPEEEQLARNEQAAREIRDPWTEQLEEYVETGGGWQQPWIAIKELVNHVEPDTTRQNQQVSRRVGYAMGALGWTKGRKRVNGRAYRGWSRPATPPL